MFTDKQLEKLAPELGSILRTATEADRKVWARGGLVQRAEFKPNSVPFELVLELNEDKKVYVLLSIHKHKKPFTDRTMTAHLALVADEPDDILLNIIKRGAQA